MNIIITGISSFIGSNLAKIFVGQGHTVFGTFSSFSKRIETLTKFYPDIKVIQVDLSEASSLYALPSDIQGIVHTSALPSSSVPTGVDIIKHNIVSTFNVANYARINKLEKFVYLSSLSIHGNISVPVVTEQTPICNPTQYGYTKYVGEKIVSSCGIPAVSLRLPGVLGPEAARAWIPETCKKLLKNEDIELFNPSNLFNNLIGVERLGEFIVNLLTDCQWQQHHAFPLGASDTLSIFKIVSILKEELKSNSNLIECSAKSNSFTIDPSYAIENFNYRPDTCLESLGKYTQYLRSLSVV